jgi:hypothetical protein
MFMPGWILSKPEVVYPDKKWASRDWPQMAFEEVKRGPHNA